MSVLHFKYQAYDADGQIQTGQISAESEKEAVRQLQGRRLVPVKLSAASQRRGLSRAKGRKIRPTDLLDFTNGLRTLVEARVPIDKALRLLAGITESEQMRALVDALRKEVKEGQSLADAMELRPDVFSKMYVNIIRAGEEGGIMHQLLPGLADFLETSTRNRQAILSAMIYPIVLVITGIISVFLLLVFVIPQFAIMFEDAGTDIPASAAFLLAMSDAIKQYGWLVPALLIGVVMWWRWQDKDPDKRLRKDRFLLSTPILGQLLLYRECAVFSRTLGALLQAGVPLIRALRVSQEVVSNTELSQSLKKVEEDVRSGTGLGTALEKTAVFPVLLHQLVAVGEETGRTGSILVKTSETFDQNVKNQMDRLVSAMQPALILVLGIAVGGITITMLSAVFSMNAVQF